MTETQDTRTETNTETSKSQEKRWRFRPRYCIEGTLYTETPLFIGSGEVFKKEIDPEDEPVEVSACMKDVNNRPIIPGSTLKGCMRQWLEENCSEKELINRVFGKGHESETDQGRGGKVTFHDAPLELERMEPTPLPFFNEDTQTFIEAHTCIERVTGTVAENKLFYQEVVPAGACFSVVITGSCDSDAEIALILAGLQGFCHDKNPLQLGSNTHSGKGGLSWHLDKVKVMEKEDVEKWLEEPGEHFWHFMKELSNEELKKLEELCTSFLTEDASRDDLTFNITLNFDSHFLVNDPPTKKEKEEAEKKIQELKKKNEDFNEREIKPPDFRPRKDEMDEVLLPASSFRGALRSQAERILRTIGLDACNPAFEQENEDNGKCCRKVEKLDDVKNLCLACMLFGAPGWKSPLEISDFKLKPDEYECTQQEFLAIDRFTGGGMHGAKFNACAIYKPIFQGEVKINSKRLKLCGSENCQKLLGLLAFTLRDLIEGDITFGFGASKGYGTCTADIKGWEHEGFRSMASSEVNLLKKNQESEESGPEAPKS